MDTPIPVDLGRIAQDLQIRRVQVESVVQLLDEGNTVPFITRYRKERTGNLNEVAIREIQSRVKRLRDLAERKDTILKAIEAQGKLSEDLREAIRGADNPKRLEDLYLPYKPKKRTKASDAREKGLEPLALRIWNRDETLADLNAAASEFLAPDKGLDTPEQVLEGVGHILAESINELAIVRDAVRRAVWKAGKVVTTKGENLPEGQGLEYRDYFEYSEPVGHIPPHRVLAINRGDKEGPLKVKLEVPRQDLERAILSQLPLEGHPHAETFHKAALDALDRLLMPSLEREVRRDLTDMAERHAVDVFARNLRSLLLQPPISKQIVMAIDPGFRTGCKVAILDLNGELLEQTVIHPHQPQNRRYEAKQAIKDLVGKHQVGVVAIGNGTACRETEELVAEVIAEGTLFHTDPEAAAKALAQPAPSPIAEEPAPVAEASDSESPSPDATPETPSLEAPAELASEGPSETHDSAPEADVEAPVAETAPAPTPDEASSVENSPPILGGAPDNEAEPAPKPNDDLTPGADVPSESSPPPSSAYSEPHHPGTSAERADILEKPDAPETRNPARQDDEATPPPILGGAPEEGEDLSLSPPENPEDAPAETAIDTVPPPPPEGPADTDTDTGPAPADSPSPDLTPTPDPSVPAETTETIHPGTETGSTAGETLGDEVPPVANAEGTAETPSPTNGETTPPPPVPAKKTSPAPDFTRPPKAPKGEKGEKGDRPAGSSKPSKPKGPPPPPRPHSADPVLAQLSYVIVNEAGASVYSASPVGREEFPEFDATTRGTISIGRRLQDPLSELVKIEPQNIGVGLYQHDVNPKQLKDSLESVIESCVNFVGVDLNTASIPLLRHVSGLNALTARRLVEHRVANGPFADREQVKAIEGVGPSTYTQAAGFLKIPGATNPLDRTWIHPESYEVAAKVLEKLGFSPEVIANKEQLPALHEKLNEANLPELARELNVGEPTLHDIFEALARPERDPREDLPKPIFKKGVLKLEDLSAGMELKGTVLNVVDFGAFVDIGLKDSGLVHISQLANRYIKSPHDVVSVGDVVSVWVMGVDGERKRVSLTMVQPGTERPRAERGPGGERRQGGGEGRPQGQGGERRQGGGGGGPRPPRPAGEGGAPRAGEGPGQSQGGSGGGGRGPRPPREGQGQNRPAAPPDRFARFQPQRAQQGRGGRGGPGGPGRGGPGRGGPGRPSEGADSSITPTPSPKPKPSSEPLSKDALTGSSPLRTFGQLKQLFEARSKDSDEGDTPDQGTPESSAQGESSPDTSTEPKPENG